ncbi:MAG TPA: type I polyketide synthase, partial [Nitrolancea sp.]|nr:type I polyketide synthase [Nitrolancea sp.]
MSANEDQDTARRLKRAAAAIEKLQGRLAALEGSRREAIAVVGLGCRLPGAPDPEAYWRLLRDGVDATTEVPADRWNADALYDAEPATPGRMSTKRFGSIGNLKGFDAAFFGIAPREARSMDPQQRLLLEVAWEALEDAGIPAKSLAGSRTGVYMAACGTDYFQLLLERGFGAIDPYFASGTVHSMAAGRLSYILGLVGPSLSVDTACSSSLVAVHLACRALRAGDCELALVGGVNLILSPELGVAFSQSRMLSGDGRCKTFSAAADGYGRAEGCGAVVLKRLSRAEADGDRVLAVIRGTAVNQDGATSGLTVPNGPAQQAVIRSALADGGVPAAAVGYVEAHGTGTALGDPIEMGALGAVFGPGRTAAAPLWVGSVKTNIGHAEGAAGIAGLIKVVLALRQGEMPAHLHCAEPSAHIDWRGGSLAVPQTTQPFPERQGRRVAGVSSFGFSGTNAHVVVEAAAEEARSVAADAAPRLYVVSAQSAAALAARAERHAAHLAARAPADWLDLCHTAGAGRAHLAHRLAVVAPSPQAAAARLAAYPSGVRSGRVVGGTAPRVAFLFTGQGAAGAEAGLELAAAGGAFGATLARCGELMKGLVGRPLAEILADGGVWATRADEAQPALFALQMALVAEWRASGIEPEAVLGHSLGEYAAAVTAGVFPLETGLRLVAARGALMAGLSSEGTMLALPLGEAAARALIGGEAGVSVGAVNGPAATVLSGPRPALARLAARLPAGVEGTWLAVTHAFHSPQMAPLVEAYREVVEAEHARTPFQMPRLGFLSTLMGRVVREEVCDPGYWCRQLVEPVMFWPAVTGLAASGATHAVEIGPRPVLGGLARGCVGP